MSIVNLPIDIVIHLFDFLDWDDILKTMMTCKNFYQLNHYYKLYQLLEEKFMNNYLIESKNVVFAANNSAIDKFVNIDQVQDIPVLVEDLQYQSSDFYHSYLTEHEFRYSPDIVDDTNIPADMMDKKIENRFYEILSEINKCHKSTQNFYQNLYVFDDLLHLLALYQSYGDKKERKNIILIDIVELDSCFNELLRDLDRVINKQYIHRLLENLIEIISLTKLQPNLAYFASHDRKSIPLGQLPDHLANGSQNNLLNFVSKIVKHPITDKNDLLKIYKSVDSAQDKKICKEIIANENNDSENLDYFLIDIKNKYNNVPNPVLGWTPVQNKNPYNELLFQIARHKNANSKIISDAISILNVQNMSDTQEIKEILTIIYQTDIYLPEVYDYLQERVNTFELIEIYNIIEKNVNKETFRKFYLEDIQKKMESTINQNIEHNANLTIIDIMEFVKFLLPYLWQDDRIKLLKTINQKYQLYFVKNQIQDYLLIGVDKGIHKIEDLYQEYLDIEIGNEDFHFMHLLKDK